MERHQTGIRVGRAVGGGRVEEKKSALPRATTGWSWFLGEKHSPFLQVVKERLPRLTRGGAVFHVVGMEPNLCCFLYTLVHLSWLLGQNTGILQLYLMAQVDGVFCHCILFEMVQMDMLVMLCDPRLIWMFSVHFPTLAGNVINTWCV